MSRKKKVKIQCMLCKNSIEREEEYFQSINGVKNKKGKIIKCPQCRETKGLIIVSKYPLRGK